MCNLRKRLTQKQFLENPAEKMWARFKRAFANKLFHSMEEISLFIDNAVNEITHNIVIATCAYKYILSDPFWNEL